MGHVESAVARLGIVTGLQLEADVARALPGALVLCLGPGLDKARIAAQALVEQGVQSLMSFGIAGALAPDLRAGDLVAEPPLAAMLNAAAQTLVTVEDPALTPKAKHALLARSGAAAVDMETSAIRAVAEANGLPFTMIRAICDEAGDTIPPLALKGMAPDGTVKPVRVAAGLLTRPQDFSALLHLGRQQKAALAALERVVRDHAEVMLSGW